MSQRTARHALDVGCHAFDPSIVPSYGYVPSRGAGIAFCILFGISMLLHVFQSWRWKTWWCLVFAVGALTETIGWAGRTWSADCPYNGDAFLMQITTLIIAPTFFTAGVYVLLGRLIYLLGPSSSFLTPKWYLWIFCTCDVLSLVLQAIGGGMASVASGEINGNTKPGTNIMVSGILFQLVSITVFLLCFSDFLRRTRNRNSTVRKAMRPLIAATIFSVTLIYIRSIYRTIELLQGWSGFLITHERYFIALDGAMMILAVGVYNVIFPGIFLPEVAANVRENSDTGDFHELRSSKVARTRDGTNDDEVPIV